MRALLRTALLTVEMCVLLLALVLLLAVEETWMLRRSVWRWMVGDR